jgi:hypothetical protein
MWAPQSVQMGWLAPSHPLDDNNLKIRNSIAGMNLNLYESINADLSIHD